MLNFYSLYSGSTGNSLYLESENTKLLIDAGVSTKKIVEALDSLKVNMSDIDAILVTHEHSDHVQGLGTLAKKYQIPVYATPKTWDAMPNQKDKIEEKNRNHFHANEHFFIQDLEIHPFSIPHDATDPCGFTICCQKQKISIATDLGHMTTKILDCIQQSDFLMLEANYEPEVLKCSSYPYLLKTRIAGPNGHLSNPLAGKTIAHLIPSGLKQVMLGHLSKENNFPDLAYETVKSELAIQNYTPLDVSICVASRIKPSNKIEIGVPVLGGIYA